MKKNKWAISQFCLSTRSAKYRLKMFSERKRANGFDLRVKKRESHQGSVVQEFGFRTLNVLTS